MRIRGGLLATCLGTVCLAATIAISSGFAAVRAQAGSSSVAPQSDTDRKRMAGGGFAGSDACQGCHRAAYEAWRRSIHSRMTQPAGATVAADFSRAVALESRGHRYAVRDDAAGRRVAVSRAGSRTEFPVHYTLGEKRFQGYLSRLDDGRIYVLPLFWHTAWRRWIDWRDITPVPESDTDYRQIWNVNCFNCHATNIQRNFDVSKQRFDTTWTELGIGCEACHGPGGAHITRMVRWGQDPREYPNIDLERPGADLGVQLDIFVPRSATPRQVFDSCSYCHGNKTNYFTDFSPGDSLEDFAQMALASDPIPAHDPQGEFWPDGRPSRFNRPQALAQTGCFLKGGATCVTCHSAHGSSNEHSLKVPLANSDRLCLQCHRTPPSGVAVKTDAVDARGLGADAVDASQLGAGAVGAAADAWTPHTRHAAESPGSRCVNCHMSDVNWRLLMRRRDHTFAPPVPEVRARYGVPNACTTCHDDRTPEWAAATMDRWYGDQRRRTRVLQVADTMYAAGSGDRSVVSALAQLAVDPGTPPFLRASAAGFLGRLSASSGASTTPASGLAMPALERASRDADASVRIAAVRSLASMDSDRSVLAMAGRLSDPSRVVRVLAAEGLVFAGVSAGDLPERFRGALVAAQDEYAESLRAFGDVAFQHTALGWLRASQGRADEAQRELELAVTLDPDDPRPRIYLGVLAARAGRYEDALGLWRAVRERHPQVPNIDRLIEEATARLKDRCAGPLCNQGTVGR